MPRIHWVGDLADEAREELISYGLLDAVDVTGPVPHTEAIHLLRSATILIASGELDTGPLGRGTTAAKLFDYVASGLPILYVCDQRADAAIMLSSFDGCYVVAFDDVAGAQQAIKAGLTGRKYQRHVDGLSRRARTADLADVLWSVLA
jgi:glycosyltransferase involved in cell wall biosynthesis